MKTSGDISGEPNHLANLPAGAYYYRDLGLAIPDHPASQQLSRPPSSDPGDFLVHPS
jgi:hypothetical protein